MAPPTYFFPKVSAAELVQQGKLNHEVLRARKLDYTFHDVTSVREDCFVQETVGTGPGGHAGTFFMAMPTNGRKPARTGYYPDQQEWQEFDCTYWACIDRDMPPTPDDLVRKNPLEADVYPVKLLGHEWLVPIIRDPNGGTGLPRDWLMGADGEVDEQVQRQYHLLWTEWAGVVDLFFDPGRPDANVFQITPAEAVKRCLQLLGLRYRIDRAEQNLMHLIDSGNFFPILAAGVNLWAFWDVYVDAQKDEDAKKNGDDSPRPEPKPDGPDTEPGPEAAPPPTGPAGES